MAQFNGPLKDAIVPFTFEYNDYEQGDAIQDELVLIQNAKRIVLTHDGKPIALAKDPYFVEDDGETGLTLKAKNMSILLTSIDKFIKEIPEEDDTDKEAFTLTEPEFDMATFSGRFKTYVQLSKPKNAFFSNAKIRYFQKIIKEQ